MHSFSRLIPLRNNVSKCFKAQNKNFCFYASEVTKKDNFDAFLQSNPLVNKLIQKDYLYFDKLVQEKGKDHLLTEFERINSKLDFNTKLGRDLFVYTKELTEKIIYHERSIEDHENLSMNITEADLYKVYNTHLKNLEAKFNSGNTLVQGSNAESRLVYQSNAEKTNKLISLSLTAVPFFFTGMLGGYIDVLFGSYMKYASFFLLQGLLHSGHSNLYAKKSVLNYPFSKLVLNLRLVNKTSLQIEYYDLFRTNTVTVPLSEFTFNYEGKTLGNKDLYRLTNYHGKSIYHILLDDCSVVDSKLFEFLASNRPTKNSKYDITDVLVSRTKFINQETEHTVSSNIEEMIRIKIAAERKIDVANGEGVDLVKRTNTIEDAAVSDFYANLAKNLSANRQTLDAALGEIRGLFVSLLNNEGEAAKVAEALYKDHSVTEFKDLRRISQAEYTNVLRKNTSLGEQEVEKVVKSVLASLA